LASRRARIRLWGHRARKRECAIAGMVTWIWRNQLVMMLLVLLWRMRVFLVRIAF
jgi:hypothetical protein